MKNKSNGIGLSGLLFVIFLVLKLTDNIDWSWWWVTSPLWIPLLIVIFFLFIIFFVSLIMISLGYTEKDIKDKLKINTKIKNE